MHRIAITLGEPAGIGPDIVLQTVQQKITRELVVFGDPDCLRQRAKALNLTVSLTPFGERKPNKRNQLSIVPIPLKEKCVPGRPNIKNSSAILETLKQATNACLAGDCQALLTAPIQKSIINEAGFPFTGHTEYLAGLCDVKTVVMLFVSNALNVALQTTHLPLSAVSKQLSTESIIEKTRLIQTAMQRYCNIKHPKIAICGLNPHAGENGHLGQEEIHIIKPAIEQLKKQGLHVTGPHAADSIFNPDNRKQTDVILAMYHDQGLTPFKALNFHSGINVTIGLPFLRTSVDHGTALDLAATGKANPNSFQEALHITKKFSLATNTGDHPN